MHNSAVRSQLYRLVSAHFIPLTLVLAVSLLGGNAHAQSAVAVEDRDVGTNTGNTEKHTDKIESHTKDISKQLGGSTSDSGDDTVNGHLKHIDTLGPKPTSALSTLAAPDVDLDNITEPTADAASCGGITQAQRQNCKDIIETKNAQYKYMKSVYDMAAKRQKTLNGLQEARRNLEKEDFGKLQDNTNQTLTLIAQMQIDRQQMESINTAYEARLRYLEGEQTQLAKMASNPSGGSIISNVAANIASGFVLKKALDIQSSDDKAKPLSIEDSNGY